MDVYVYSLNRELGLVNSKNTQSSFEFLKFNLQNSLFTFANKSRFKGSNVVIQFYFISSLFLSFLAHKKHVSIGHIGAKPHCTPLCLKNYLESQSFM